MKHKRLTTAKALLFVSGLIAGLNAQEMYVKESIGTTTIYSLSNIQKMYFSSGNVNIAKTDGSNKAYQLKHLQYLSFKDNSTGIDEVEDRSEQRLSVYPNPVTNVLSVDLPGIISPNGMINIINIDGKVIKSREVTGTGIISLDVGHLPKGIYLCRYINGKEIKTIKFIKQ